MKNIIFVDIMTVVLYKRHSTSRSWRGAGESERAGRFEADRFWEGTMKRIARMTMALGVAVAVVLLVGISGAAPTLSILQSPPIAADIDITAVETTFIPFSGSDPDGDLFGFFPTSGLSDPSAGTLFSSCFCIGTYAGQLCSCTSFFTASPGFSGTVTFTYRAVDSTGLQSADATVTITIPPPGARTPGDIMTEIEHIMDRALLGGRLATQLATSLNSKLGAIRGSFLSNNINAVLAQIEALINEIRAQSGKKIDGDVANVLVMLATELQDDAKVPPAWVCTCSEDDEDFDKLLWKTGEPPFEFPFGQPPVSTPIQICRYENGVILCFPNTCKELRLPIFKKTVGDTTISAFNSVVQGVELIPANDWFGDSKTFTVGGPDTMRYEDVPPSVRL